MDIVALFADQDLTLEERIALMVLERLVTPPLSSWIAGSVAQLGRRADMPSLENQ